jgi:hypothetical protein
MTAIELLPALVRLLRLDPVRQLKKAIAPNHIDSSLLPLRYTSIGQS